MAPNISNSKKTKNEAFKFRKDLKKKIFKYQNFINKNFKYVGDNFAQEVRNIYYNKQNSKGIYGNATLEEINGFDRVNLSDWVRIIFLYRCTGQDF